MTLDTPTDLKPGKALQAICCTISPPFIFWDRSSAIFCRAPSDVVTRFVRLSPGPTLHEIGNLALATVLWMPPGGHSFACRKIARELGVGAGTVQRVRQEMDGPFVVVAASGRGRRNMVRTELRLLSPATTDPRTRYRRSRHDYPCLSYLGRNHRDQATRQRTNRL